MLKIWVQLLSSDSSLSKTGIIHTVPVNQLKSFKNESSISLMFNVEPDKDDQVLETETTSLNFQVVINVIGFIQYKNIKNITKDNVIITVFTGGLSFFFQSTVVSKISIGSNVKC
jgi:hypothetical protein